MRSAISNIKVALLHNTSHLMNDLSTFETILAVFFVAFTPLAVITFTFFDLKRMDKHFEEHDRELAEKKPDCEGNELEKFLSGFDYA